MICNLISSMIKILTEMWLREYSLCSDKALCIYGFLNALITLLVLENEMHKKNSDIFQ